MRNLIGTCVVALAVACAACGDGNAAFEQLTRARQTSADLRVQFTKAADGANRAVMADTDDASVAAAKDARAARQAVHRDTDTLGPMLTGLHFNDESAVLQEFAARFKEYETLDDRILELPVENTNLKAQRLSFGPAQKDADDFQSDLDAVVASVSASEAWRARALAATAVAGVRDIQALQAPHIAEPDDAAMVRLETRMTSEEASVRKALDGLASIVPVASRQKLTHASSVLDAFMKINADILALSHRNTNVRSLALSLSEKPAVVAACEDLLHRLNDALGKRGLTATPGK